MNNYKLFDSHFGFASKEEFHSKIETLYCLAFGDFGKNINLKLLKEGKLVGKKFEDIIDNGYLGGSYSDKISKTSELNSELDRINDSLKLSYRLLEFYNESLLQASSKIDDNQIQDPMIAPVQYFGIQAHFTLEYMRNLLLVDPKEYFKQKSTAERNAA